MQKIRQQENNKMVYIITSKTKRRGNRKFSEKYLHIGGIERAEGDGISKFAAFQEINGMTEGMHVDERREIVNEFITREKPI
jgi:hypothetical protein